MVGPTKTPITPQREWLPSHTFKAYWTPIKRSLGKLDARVCFRPAQTLRQILVRPKDPVPAHLKNGTVYKVPCKVCSKAYVGQSGRSLECRLKEHQCTVHNGNVAASAIAEHAWKYDHQTEWERARVLDSCRYLYARRMLESWHIHQCADPLNRERGPLPNIYSLLSS